MKTANRYALALLILAAALPLAWLLQRLTGGLFPFMAVFFAVVAVAAYLGSGPAIGDAGIGIPTQMLSHIWEMFVQVDKRLERPQGGLGIGLTLAKRIVDLHGGTVDSRSPGDNQGSTFIVRLPLA